MSTCHRLYGERKTKRHVYLTDFAHNVLLDLAASSCSSPSEVCEQIIRAHALARGIPFSAEAASKNLNPLTAPTHDDRYLP